MADERVPTADEVAANVAKANAEAARAEAEAAWFTAQTREMTAKAAVAELSRDQEERNHQAKAVSDDRRHVYRFVTTVGDSSVRECMRHLTEWSRLEPGCDMEVIFYSPGGEVFSGMALFDFLQMLRKSGHKLTTGCAGMAASMAGVLLQAGDVRWCGEQSWVLIHRAKFGAIGSSYQVEDEVEFVKRIEKRIVEIFVKRSDGRLTAQKIKRNWDRKDWWIAAEEALELGLVDEIRGALDTNGSGA